MAEEETEETTEGYSEDEIESLIEEKAQEKATKIFEQRAKDKKKAGRAEAVEALGLNPNSFDDDLAEMQEDDFKTSVQTRLEKKRERESELEEEKLQELKSEIRQEVESEYEPFKKQAEKLKRKTLQSEVQKLASEVGFSDTVIEGSWSEDFIRDVENKVQLDEENGEYIAVDENNEPVISPGEDKDYKTLDDVVQQMSQEGKWSTFATSQETNGEPSGINEDTSTTSTDEKTRSEMSSEEKHAFIKENGHEAYLNLPK